MTRLPRLMQCLLPALLLWTTATIGHAADAPVASAASATAARTPVAPLEATFIDNAARANLAEIRLGELVLQKTAVPEVKFFAQRMMDEHRANQDSLRQLAELKGVKLPDGLSVQDQQLYDRLGKLAAPQLEHDYIGIAGLKGHLDARKLFTAYVQEGKDKDLVSYAQMTLPTINDHLEMARHMLANSKSE